MRELFDHLQRMGIRDSRVLDAMRFVPREIFVSRGQEVLAYDDEALPIECDQTISQPFIVALMTQEVIAEGDLQKVLEIGTGSGYQAAVLSQLFSEVYSVERYQTLSQTAEQRFIDLGLENIHVKHGDGFLGWEEHAPFDAIVVTAAAEKIPEALLQQLSSDHGRLIMPVGHPFATQLLTSVVREGDHYQYEAIDSVAFVPLLPGIKDQ